MPIWLRNFTFSQMKDHFDKQNAAAEKNIQSKTKKSPQIAKPNIKPAYTTKASK